MRWLVPLEGAMKSLEEIDEARRVVKKWFHTAGISRDQKTLLMGLSVALCWVAEVGGTTLQDLVDGRPMFVRDTVQDTKEQPQ
jgi:hypothetical protein